MSKRIKITRSKNSESYSIIDDYTHPLTRKKSTYVVESFGNINRLMDRFHVNSSQEALDALKAYLEEMRNDDKEDNSKILISLSQHNLIEKDKQRLYNIGYLYPRNILFSLGISEMCDDIFSRHQFHYNLAHIIADLVSARIIFPGSKRSSYKDAFHFLDAPQYSLDDVYRSLPVLASERYFIESYLYSSTTRLHRRNTAVLYYDCTNFYFEIEDEKDNLLKYGKSKENRPNPIVQYGLFMDGDGIPIADYVFNGNNNEQFSLRELEEKISKDFKFTKFVVCADAGLNGWDNKIYNDKKPNGAYIVTQPIRKLKKYLKDWATGPDGWKLLNLPGEFSIDSLEDTITINGRTYRTNQLTFYKERWIKTTKKDESTGKNYTLEEHLIVSFSTKYQKYQQKIRNRKLDRARKLLKNPGKIDRKNSRNPTYYIKKTSTKKNGEVAQEDYYTLDMEKINEEARYDGFYGVTTDLEDEDISLIIKANRQRWEIEESFEIMKSEFKTRPMYVTREDAVLGHLLICFMALLIYRILEKKYLKEEYTCCEIIDTLRNMNIVHLIGSNYTPAFMRTEITDRFSEIFGFENARELLTQKYLKKFLRTVNSKKSTKLKSTKKGPKILDS